jgi:hypothetical protein
VQQKVMMTRILDNIGWAYFLSGNYQAAGQYLLRGYKLAISLGLLSEIVMVSDHLSHLFEKICKPDSAILFFRINKVHSDSLLKAQSINVVRLAEVKMEFDKEVREKQTQLVYNRQLQKRNLAISVAVVVVLIALIIILMMRLKIINQKKRRIEAEKRQAEVEQQATRNLLESQNKELVTKVMHSTRVNELVISIAEKLKRLELHEDSENARIRNELIRELLSSANKDDSWKEFELRFQNVQLDFYERLRSGFPNLTSSEVRLCAFLKLDMNTKEISAVTRQTERAIIVARHRLRQKLGLKNTDNLPLFLSQF